MQRNIIWLILWLQIVLQKRVLNRVIYLKRVWWTSTPSNTALGRGNLIAGALLRLDGAHSPWIRLSSVGTVTREHCTVSALRIATDIYLEGV